MTSTTPPERIESPAEQRRKLILAHRLLIFSGSSWLLISWLLVIGLRRPLLPTIDTWLPGVRLMMSMAAVGLVIIWPMAAMTTTRSISPGRTLRESIVLLGLAQLIVWPAGLVTPWTMSRLILLACVLTGWGLLAAGLTAWGRARPRAVCRTSIMGICLIMMLMAPALLLISDTMNWPVAWSPLTNIWNLAGGGIDPPDQSEWVNAAILWAAAIASCLFALVTRPESCQAHAGTRRLSP